MSRWIGWASRSELGYAFGRHRKKEPVVTGEESELSVSRRAKRAGLGVVLAAAAIAASGCSACAGSGCTKTLSSSEIEAKARTALNQQLAASGKAVTIGSVSCPNALNLKVGTSEVCTGTDSAGENLIIKATITSVSGSGGDLHFDAHVATSSPSPSTPTPGTTT